MMRTRVYLSGPITLGDREHNFKQAADAQRRLMLAGFAVLNPMLSMQLPGAWDIPHDVWIANDLPWIAVADVVLRLPGESTGADEECAFAADICEVPVYTDIEQLLHDQEEIDNVGSIV